MRSHMSLSGAFQHERLPKSGYAIPFLRKISLAASVFIHTVNDTLTRNRAGNMCVKKTVICLTLSLIGAICSEGISS
jgi:hypothetical protein